MKAILLAVFALAVSASLALSAGTTTINVPAPGMYGAVQEFKQEFALRYSMQSRAIPIASLLYQASALPTSPSDAKLLDTTSTGTPRVATFADGGTSIVSDGQPANGIGFPVLLNGGKYSLGVDVPAHLVTSIAVQNSNGALDSVTFTFVQPITFHTENISVGLPIPKTLLLNKLSISNRVIIYSLTDGPGAGAGQYVLNLNIGGGGGAK